MITLKEVAEASIFMGDDKVTIIVFAYAQGLDSKEIVLIKSMFKSYILSYNFGTRIVDCPVLVAESVTILRG